MLTFTVLPSIITVESHIWPTVTALAFTALNALIRRLAGFDALRLSSVR